MLTQAYFLYTKQWIGKVNGPPLFSMFSCLHSISCSSICKSALEYCLTFCSLSLIPAIIYSFAMPTHIPKPAVTMSGSPQHYLVDNMNNIESVPVPLVIVSSHTPSRVDYVHLDDDDFEEFETPEESDFLIWENELEEGEVLEGVPIPSLDRNVRCESVAADILRRFPWIQGSDALANLSWTCAQQNATNRSVSRHIPNPPAIEFLNSLSGPNFHEISSDDRCCAICLAPYANVERPEKPLRLPCNHVFGEACLWNWMSQIGSATNTDCPLCRIKHVEQRHSLKTTEGLAQLLDLADYLLNDTSRVQIDEEGRANWQELRDSIGSRLAELRARQQNEMSLRRLFYREIRESGTVSALSPYLTTEDREELHRRITTAIFEWDAWRRPDAEWDNLDVEITDAMDEERAVRRH